VFCQLDLEYSAHAFVESYVRPPLASHQVAEELMGQFVGHRLNNLKSITFTVDSFVEEQSVLTDNK
jgi:hypothetical protein